MLIIDMPMPWACNACPMLDERGDYPMCCITGETRGYDFDIFHKRMNRCPIKSELLKCGECKYGVSKYEIADGKEIVSCGKHSVSGIYHYSDFYCADGERREQKDDQRCQKCKYQSDTEFDACHICINEKDMFRPMPSSADGKRREECSN